jgi:hypothetical protein
MSCFRQSKRRAALFLSMILHQAVFPRRNVLSWMVEAVEARFVGKTAPSLLSGVLTFTLHEIFQDLRTPAQDGTTSAVTDRDWQ